MTSCLDADPDVHPRRDHLTDPHQRRRQTGPGHREVDWTKQTMPLIVGDRAGHRVLPDIDGHHDHRR
jgi:hypothetical protein